MADKAQLLEEAKRLELISQAKELESSKESQGDWRDTKLPFDTTPRGLIQGGLDALPTAGMVGGGILGAGTGTIAAPGVGTALMTVGGAGLGNAAGESLKNLGEKYLLDKDKTRAEIYGNPAKGFVEGATGEMGGQALSGGLKMAAKAAKDSGAVDAVKKAAGKTASYLSSSFSGVPQKEIEVYAKYADEINKMAKAADNDPQELADALRRKYNDTLKAHKGKLNEQITEGLSKAKDTKIDVTKVVDKLEEFKTKLNPSLHPEAIKDVDDLINRVKGASKASKTMETGLLTTGEKMAVDMPGQTVPGTKSKTISSNPTTELMDEVPKKYSQKLKGKVNSIESVPVAESMPSTEPKFPEWTTGASGKWAQEIPKEKIIELAKGGGGPKYSADPQTVNDITKFLQDQAAPAYGQSKVGFQIGDAAAQSAKAGAAAGREALQGSVESLKAPYAGLSRLHDIEDVMGPGLLAEGKSASPLFAAGSGGNPANAKVLRQLGEETGSDMLLDAQKLSAARTFGKPSLLPVDATGKSLTRIGVAGAAGFLLGGVPGAVITEGLASPAAIKAAINAGLITKKAADVLSKTVEGQGLLAKGLLSAGVRRGLITQQQDGW